LPEAPTPVLPRGTSINFDREANSMYNHGFPRVVRRKK
jgi:hypothetical protein